MLFVTEPVVVQIVTQPQDQSVLVGNEVSFNVSASGSGTLNYQWRFNNVNIDRATNNILTLSNVQTNQAGLYKVVVSSSQGGSQTSREALLTVFTNTAPHPILAMTTNAVAPGGTITMPVNLHALGTENSVSLSLNFDPSLVRFISVNRGAALASGSLVSNTNQATSGKVAVMAGLGAGVAFSAGSNQLVTVQFQVLTTTPANTQIPIQFSDDPTARDISDVDAGSYANVSYMPGRLDVMAPPQITSGLTNQTVYAGAQVTWNMTVSGTAPFTYQWRKDGTLIGSNDSLSIANVHPSQAGIYTVVVSNGVGSATNSATLTVIAPPTISSDLADQTVSQGSNVTLSVGVTGTNPSYRWYRIINSLATQVSTATALVLDNVQASSAGQYYVEVWNAAGTNVSRTATLTVLVPPTINEPNLRDAVVAIGGTLTLSVGVSGSSPISYAWYQVRNSVTNAMGNGVSLVISNIQSSMAGQYYLVVSNTAGWTNSRLAMVQVVNPSVMEVRAAEIYSGMTLDVPVWFRSQGVENAIGFSLGYDPALLQLQTIASGTGMPTGSQVIYNTNQAAAAGKVGVAAVLPSGQVFGVATQQVVVARFIATTNLTADTNMMLSFGDVPVIRELSNVNGEAWPSEYRGANVAIKIGWEGDTAPRPYGDARLTATDWTMVGRFVAGLTTITNGLEFVRADCAPRSTLGDGRLTATDWTQVGRYIAGLDAKKGAGGSMGGWETQMGASQQLASSMGEGGTQPVLRMGTNTVVQGETASMAVVLDAVGQENSVSFSLSFDATQVRFLSITNGSGLGSGATFIANTNQASGGKIGVLLGLESGVAFPAGSNELAVVRFEVISTTAAGTLSVINFSDDPTARDISDIDAGSFGSITYRRGAITVTGAGGIAVWRMRYFSSGDLADAQKEATVWGNEADPDGDGRSNLFEYAVGSNPTKSEVNQQGVSVELFANAGQQYARITFKQLKNDSSVQYVPEVSTDRQTWSSNSSQIQFISTTSLNEEFNTVVYHTVSSVAVGQPLYLRLKVAKN